MQEARVNVLNRLDKQLVTIEDAIKDLIGRADLSELSSAECLNFAVKFMNQHSRVLALKNSLLIEQPEKREHAMMATLMRQMRGEDATSTDSSGHACDGGAGVKERRGGRRA
jgi:hypothetical protein